MPQFPGRGWNSGSISQPTSTPGSCILFVLSQEFGPRQLVTGLEIISEYNERLWLKNTNKNVSKILCYNYAFLADLTCGVCGGGDDDDGDDSDDDNTSDDDATRLLYDDVSYRCVLSPLCLG